MDKYIAVTLYNRLHYAKGGKISTDKKQGHYITTTREFDIDSVIDGDPDPNEYYVIQHIEMTKEEYEKLPDFQGF